MSAHYAAGSTVQVERVADINGQAAFVVVIDGAVHFAFRDPEAPGNEPLCRDCDHCLNGDPEHD